MLPIVERLICLSGNVFNLWILDEVKEMKDNL
jgi:hypothetical protein